jgi:putative heme-binding domain-containing protein
MSIRLLLLSLLAVGGVCIVFVLYAKRPLLDNDPTDGSQTRAGFRVELVYEPSLTSEGSWVSLTVDDRGRLIASDQYGLLYRVTPSPIGGESTETRCEPIRVGVGAAQGMAFVNNSLYVVVNVQSQALNSGLYRVTDTDGDDKFDNVEELMSLRGSGEHGPHAVVASPDGKSLYLCAGNYTGSPLFKKSRVPAGWGEDQLLPRLNDPVGQGTGVPAPGGWIVKTDLDGQESELFSVGFRNIYDMSFNEHGELFTSDSDLDVDIGTPWYRPPALLHVTSGADYGWRGGDGIWPSYYPDTLPPTATMPPGSPSGLAAGIGTKFPEPYQSAMFIGDWSRGTIYAVQLDPTGASYRGECEPVAVGVGAVTDLVVRPQDGALYFTIGGRQTQSGLYRLIWTGEEASIDGDAAGSESAGAEDLAARGRAERRALEELHGEQSAGAVAKAWRGLSSPDRFIRFAALTALERATSGVWHDQALSETNILARSTALIGLARRDEPAEAAKWVEAILAVNFPELSAAEQQAVLRAASHGVIRFKKLNSALRQRLAAGIELWYPTQRRQVDPELAKLLVRLESPAIIQPLAKQLAESATSEQAIDAAVTLSAATAGFSKEFRTALLDWFDLAAVQHGRRSFYPYLVAARARFIAGFDPDEKKAFATRLKAPSQATDGPVSQPAREFVEDWTAEEVEAVVESSIEKRGEDSSDQLSGRQIFLALGCANCHAVGGEGSSVGPGLTNVGRRYSVSDLARAITRPSDEIPDLYRQTTFMVGGSAITGRVTNMTSTTISVTTDIRDPASAVKLRRNEIDSQKPSPLSAMPSNLLDTLNASEVASLFAYLRGA